MCNYHKGNDRKWKWMPEIKVQFYSTFQPFSNGDMHLKGHAYKHSNNNAWMRICKCGNCVPSSIYQLDTLYLKCLNCIIMCQLIQRKAASTNSKTKTFELPPNKKCKNGKMEKKWVPQSTVALSGAGWCIHQKDVFFFSLFAMHIHTHFINIHMYVRCWWFNFYRTTNIHLYFYIYFINKSRRWTLLSKDYRKNNLSWIKLSSRLVILHSCTVY